MNVITNNKWIGQRTIRPDVADKGRGPARLVPGHPSPASPARTEAIAAQACELIEVDYEVLPWTIEIEDAILPDAPVLHEFMKFEGKPSNIAGRIEVKKGDIAQGFAEAEIV